MERAKSKRDVERDRERAVYYMSLAVTVRNNANCWGSEVGAVLVCNDRVISTGYNGTPSRFLNCREGGCIRCEERHWHKKDPAYESPHPEVMEGKALDICLCVHAEQNALLSAARHGIAVDGSVLYATHQPCFSCLKESIQAGVRQVIYLEDWYGAEGQGLRDQYDQLSAQLYASDAFPGFHQLDKKTFQAFVPSVTPLFLRTETRDSLRCPAFEIARSRSGGGALGVDPDHPVAQVQRRPGCLPLLGGEAGDVRERLLGTTPRVVIACDDGH
jgi:dCMP deaminase